MRGPVNGPVVMAVALLLAGCAGTSVQTSAGGEEPTPCEQVIPECHAKRLPNVILRGDEKDGALGPVNESLDGTISFDEALSAAWREDAQAGETVQVVLGSADPQAMHWDSKGDLFYGIDWGGVCIYPIGGRPHPYESPIPPTCSVGTWGTVIDAHTGAFIVGGNG